MWLALYTSQDTAGFKTRRLELWFDMREMHWGDYAEASGLMEEEEQ